MSPYNDGNIDDEFEFDEYSQTSVLEGSVQEEKAERKQQVMDHIYGN